MMIAADNNHIKIILCHVSWAFDYKHKLLFIFLLFLQDWLLLFILLLLLNLFFLLLSRSFHFLQRKILQQFN